MPSKRKKKNRIVAKRSRKHARSSGSSLITRRLPKPKALPSQAQYTGPANNKGHRLVEKMVALHLEACQATGQPLFQIWEDWLVSTETWLGAVEQVGELGATIDLPEETKAAFNDLHERYALLSAHYPSAYRKMGELFTAMFRLLADCYPAIDLPGYVTQSKKEVFHPDILGQSFCASLGYPKAWSVFFPDWTGCVRTTKKLLPYKEITEEVYSQLGAASIHARKAGRQVTLPIPGDNDTWQVWLKTILPYVTPIIIDQEITSSTALLAIAGQLPDWIVKNGFVRFSWSKLANDPMLNKILSVNSRLYGLNGFYIGKAVGNIATINAIEEAMANVPEDALVPLAPNASPIPSPPPTTQQPDNSGTVSFQKLFQSKRG